MSRDKNSIMLETFQDRNGETFYLYQVVIKSSRRLKRSCEFGHSFSDFGPWVEYVIQDQHKNPIENFRACGEENHWQKLYESMTQLIRAVSDHRIKNLREEARAFVDGDERCTVSRERPGAETH